MYKMHRHGDVVLRGANRVPVPGMLKFVFDKPETRHVAKMGGNGGAPPPVILVLR